MSKKVYVGNLSYGSTESQLSDLFAEYGNVLSTKVIKDQFTGRSKGFAFIEMETDEEAIAAISALNGKEFDGRNLKVNEAFEKNSRRGHFQKRNDSNH
ncbi:MAG: RNA-binding protein [Spirochaetes bacterium]|nr:RNA-binding protein [Spirochaetota bacterium]